MSGVNPQSSREELTQLLTDVVPTQTQMSRFVKNGRVDLNQAFSEVNRRASKIDCTDFECSLERFKALATECGEINDSSVEKLLQSFKEKCMATTRMPNVWTIDLMLKVYTLLLMALGSLKI